MGEELFSVSRIIKNRLRQAGYNSDKLTAHSLRHTAITLALEAKDKDGNTKVNIQEARDFARHENISTTLIYAHNLDAGKSIVSQLIEESILGAN